MAVILEADRASRDFVAGGTVVHALREASVRIEQGTLVLLQGPSGSGKTTLINLLGGLDVPTAGAIHFEGVALHTASDAERDELRRLRMGFIFQSVGLITLMSAWENVEFGLRIAGFDPAARARRVEECLALVGLSKRMDHRPTELSGGEQQRVAIARCLAQQPDLFLLDEPTAALDWRAQRELLDLVREVHDSRRLTTLFVTHDLTAVPATCDRIVLMKQGQIVDDGAPAALLTDDTLSRLFDVPLAAVAGRRTRAV